MIKGLLVDVDGTLVLSNDAHAHSWVETLAVYGYEVPLDKVRGFMGMGGDQMLPQLIPGLTDNHTLTENISKDRKKLFLEKFVPHLSPTPGARKLVERLKSENIRYVIASSSTDEELKPLLKLAGIEELVKLKTSGSEVEESKPEPDIVKAALKKINLPPTDVLMLGDTPYDIEAASKCGVGVIALRSGGFSDGELKGAKAIYDDPSDLLTHFNNSPICK